jgi:hypothetical protein
MNFVREAESLPDKSNTNKLSVPVATGFNSLKAFRGGNWRKN